MDGMAEKGLVLDYLVNGNRYYMLAPAVIGFFEFTFMKTRSDLPIKKVAALMERYTEETMIHDIFGSKTRIARALINEDNAPPEVSTHILSHEEAKSIIKEAGGGSLSTCFCRHAALHTDKPCKKGPMEDICIAFGKASDFLVRRKFGRKATVDELLEVLEKARKLGLAHIADNIKNSPTFICNCCSCCCGFLKSATKLRVKRPVATSNFIAKIDREKCNGCGLCAKACSVAAVEVIRDKGRPLYARLKENECIGCAVCLPKCKTGAIILVERKEKVRIPRNTKEKYVRIAREKGRLTPIVGAQLKKWIKRTFHKNPYL